MSHCRKFLCLSVESVCLLVCISVDISACYHVYLSVCLSVEYVCLSSVSVCRVFLAVKYPVCRLFLTVDYFGLSNVSVCEVFAVCIWDTLVCRVFLYVGYFYLWSMSTV
jgi:hypothetical protein